MLKITPSNNLIEFQLQVENASLDKTTARIILEVNNVNTIIPMEMDSDGKCTGEIPLKEFENNTVWHARQLTIDDIEIGKKRLK